MAREVTKDFSPDLVEKIVVPTERHLRSHGDTKKVVDVKVRYPGYVFCKIRLTEDVYETLQELELARSWMGTINRRGHKKLPPVPMPLNEEEVAKFKGLEEQAEMFEDMYGGDFSGRNDKGEDLLAQYAGYEVGQMVKILRGNFEGEDGTVRRLKGGQIMVRMFTYGQTFDNWFDPDAIRPLTDLEVMRGLGGPTKPIDQDQFDVSMGTKDPSILRDNVDFEDSRVGRTSLLQSSGSGPDRNRKQDRIARGETGKDLFGRTPEEIKQEEANWLAYREEKRANQRAAPVVAETPAKKKKAVDGPAKGHDTWGIVERSSWDGGEFGFDNFVEEEKAARKRLEELYIDRGEFRSYDRNQRGRGRDSFDTRGPRQGRDFRDDKGRGRDSFDTRGPRQGRDFRDDNRQSFGRDNSRGRGSFGDSRGRGHGSFDDNSRGRGRGSFDDRQRRDFGDRQQGDREQRRPVRDSRFGRPRPVREEDWASQSEAVNNDSSDDFFSSLMKELKDDVDSTPQRARGSRHHDNAGPNVKSRSSDSEEDSFFENLMSELGNSLESESAERGSPSSKRDSSSDDDFFANLENELSSSLGGNTKQSSADAKADDDAFFESLQSELTSSLNRGSSNNKDDSFFSDDDFFDSLQESMDGTKPTSDDFFAGLMDDVADEIDRSESKNPAKSPVKVVQTKGNHGDFDSMTVPELKEMLKERGLKVGGRKSELIERLQGSN
jgi:transcription antitermination factor NusG